MMAIVKRYGVQARDGSWLRRMILDAEAVDVAWDPRPDGAWSGSEREAKAVSELIPQGPSHPLRVRPVR
jgi:hypothetical protein